MANFKTQAQALAQANRKIFLSFGSHQREHLPNRSVCSFQLAYGIDSHGSHP